MDQEFIEAVASAVVARLAADGIGRSIASSPAGRRSRSVPAARIASETMPGLTDEDIEAIASQIVAELAPQFAGQEELPADTIEI